MVNTSLSIWKDYGIKCGIKKWDNDKYEDLSQELLINNGLLLIVVTI
jgi:hypothetical protein